MAKIIEEQRNLFDSPQGCWLAHCVSADFEMGAGIAKQFNQKYAGAKEYLRREFPIDSEFGASIGMAIVHSNVVYLVTKHRYFEKPTYDSMQDALHNLRRAVREMCIHQLAIPKLGCGLDKLNWEVVKKMIETTFENDEDLVITICYQ